MTPLELAQNMARSDDPKARILAVAMVARSLSDDDPNDPFRQGWPVEASAVAAARHLGLGIPTPEFLTAVIETMPTVSDALLNRSPRS